MNVIIFSKNRAAQLDLLFRSIEKYWYEHDKNAFYIIYRCDGVEYEKGYDLLKTRYDWPIYIKEINFKSDLLTKVPYDSDYIGLFCDDDIFIREFKWNRDIMLDPEIVCISLRLGKNIISHYIKGPCQIPEIVNGTWDWLGKSIDWGYPMSAGSGHIFRVLDVEPIFEKGIYSNPTELEDAMNAAKIDRPKMFCYDYSLVVNLAINRVQTRRNTLCGKITIQELNGEYLIGKQIDIEPFHHYNNTSVHEIVEELQWLN